MVYVEEIKTIIKNIISYDNEIDNICLDTSLQQLGLNSILFIEVIIAIENYFNIEFPDEKMIFSNVYSIRDLYNIVNNQTNA